MKVTKISHACSKSYYHYIESWASFIKKVDLKSGGHHYLTVFMGLDCNLCTALGTSVRQPRSCACMNGVVGVHSQEMLHFRPSKINFSSKIFIGYERN